MDRPDIDNWESHMGTPTEERETVLLSWVRRLEGAFQLFTKPGRLSEEDAREIACIAEQLPEQTS